MGTNRAKANCYVLTIQGGLNCCRLQNVFAKCNESNSPNNFKGTPELSVFYKDTMRLNTTKVPIKFITAIKQPSRSPGITGQDIGIVAVELSTRRRRLQGAHPSNARERQRRGQLMQNDERAFHHCFIFLYLRLNNKRTHYYLSCNK